MHEILSGRLWLGHALDIRNPAELFNQQIAAVVDLAYEEPAAQLPREMIYCRFPLNDGGGNGEERLRLAVSTLVELLRSGTRALVGCSAGRSRSPVIAAFAMAAYLGELPEEALQRIATIKPLEIHSHLWTALQSCCSGKNL